MNDLADALVFLAENYESGDIINIGSGDELSILELADTIAEVVEYSGKIETDRTKPDGMARKLLDSSKLSALGWKAKTPLKEGLREMYAHVRAEGILTP